MKYAKKWHPSPYRRDTNQLEGAMPESTNVHSFHVIVDAPAEAVFDFVNDLTNLPRWSIHWCKSARLAEHGAIVNTTNGEMYFGVTGDRDRGVLDWWAGPTMETAQRWPTRVVGLPDGRTLYSVTAIFGGNVPPNVDAWFADELGTLKRLVEEQLVSV